MDSDMVPTLEIGYQAIIGNKGHMDSVMKIHEWVSLLSIYNKHYLSISCSHRLQTDRHANDGAD